MGPHAPATDPGRSSRKPGSRPVGSYAREMRVALHPAVALVGLACSLGAVVAGLACSPLSPAGRAAREAPPVLCGVDVLEASKFARLAGKRVGLLTNRTGRSLSGERTLDLLRDAPEVELVRVFTPEHGLDSVLEGKVADATDEGTGLQLVSLYGESRRPTQEVLADLDVVVFDVQDVGVRFYTYSTTLLYLLEACAEAGVAVLVLDRPNPIAPWGPRGAVSDPERRSFICPADMPLAHGLTLGEFATWQVAEHRLSCALEVVPCEGWDPTRGWEATSREWLPPSPNLREPLAAELYPMLGMLEATEISVGRGTERPFTRLGAPWIRGAELLEAFRARALPGIEAEFIRFQPEGSVHAGEVCEGLEFRLTEPSSFTPILAGLTLAVLLQEHAPESFTIERVDERLASRRLLALAASQTPGPSELHAGVDAWVQRVSPHLLYPRSWEQER